MIVASFWTHWVWPAGGSGGIPGDVVGSFVWAILVGVMAVLVWPRVRHATERFLKRHLDRESAAIHRKLDHIIEHHPDIPPLDQ